jgi:hypothetical protein
MIQFDHLRLVKRQPTEVARFRRYLLSAMPGDLREVAVFHEDDGSCCRREQWHETASAIVLAVKPPTAPIMVNLYGETATDSEAN